MKFVLRTILTSANLTSARGRSVKSVKAMAKSGEQQRKSEWVWWFGVLRVGVMRVWGGGGRATVCESKKILHVFFVHIV